MNKSDRIKHYGFEDRSIMLKWGPFFCLSWYNMKMNVGLNYIKPSKNNVFDFLVRQSYKQIYIGNMLL